MCILMKLHWSHFYLCSWVKPVFRSPSLLLHNLVLDEGSISEEVETTLINVKCSFYNNVNCSLVHSIIRNSADFGHFLHETDSRINRCAQYHQIELHIVDLSSSIWFNKVEFQRVIGPNAPKSPTSEEDVNWTVNVLKGQQKLPCTPGSPGNTGYRNSPDHVYCSNSQDRKSNITLGSTICP